MAVRTPRPWGTSEFFDRYEKGEEICPFCGAEGSLDYTDLIVRGWYITHEVYCTNCGYEWTANYKFMAITNYCPPTGEED